MLAVPTAGHIFETKPSWTTDTLQKLSDPNKQKWQLHSKALCQHTCELNQSYPCCKLCQILHGELWNIGKLSLFVLGCHNVIFNGYFKTGKVQTKDVFILCVQPATLALTLAKCFSHCQHPPFCPVYSTCGDFSLIQYILTACFVLLPAEFSLYFTCSSQHHTEPNGTCATKFNCNSLDNNGTGFTVSISDWS